MHILCIIIHVFEHVCKRSVCLFMITLFNLQYHSLTQSFFFSAFANFLLGAAATTYVTYYYLGKIPSLDLCCAIASTNEHRALMLGVLGGVFSAVSELAVPTPR